ncbi:MAG: NAD(P)H-hydrate dehydratase [Clostridia bacterium]|nr:NAD(P)H-hydrate dehydratase [Clostridia bacterium]
MMNCGIDIIEISRIREAVEQSDSFMGKVFSEKEIEYFRANGQRFESLAGFFAAKEAFVKYKKTGIRGLGLSEISVEHEGLGAPYIVFRGRRQKVSLSISHGKTYAVEVVCGDSDHILPVCEEMRKLIPERAEDANKGDCGRVLVIAGSQGMTGAACLAARGALRCGAGLVTVAVPRSERPIVAISVQEAMTVALDECDGMIIGSSMKKILQFAKRAQAVVFGPGLGINGEMHHILRGILSEYEGTLIIDADGLNALSKNCDILRERKCSVVITPHPGEMSRLVKKTVEEIQNNREVVAAEFAAKYGITVVLKGKNTVIAGGDEIKINTSGNCGMATGGTGDVLSGVVAAFVAQGLKPFDAAALGAYIHGKAGDIATQKLGVHGMLAGDLAECLPLAIKSELEG